MAVQAPNILTVPANSPYRSVADIIAAQKAKPSTVTFASAGNGTSDHLTAELFWQETQTRGVHVPYKGGAPAMQDLLGGQVDATFMNINTGLPADIKAWLHDAIVAGLNDPKVKDSLLSLGFEIVAKHARAVHRLPGRRVRALEEGDRNGQDHRGLKTGTEHGGTEAQRKLERTEMGSLLTSVSLCLRVLFIQRRTA